MKRYFPFILIALAVILISVFFYYSGQKKQVYKKLPVIGNRYLDTIGDGNSMRIDTVYHTIPPFEFINQDGNKITQDFVKGKVYVTDFFFTTCKTICPVMSKQLDRVYKAYSDNPDVMILSHTVDPETDDPAQLKKYAESFNADTKRWIFLTGSKKELYEQARKGYLLNNEEGSGDAEDFIHTQNFALIDRQGRIRGVYDGTVTKDVDLLIKDIKSLLIEN